MLVAELDLPIQHEVAPHELPVSEVSLAQGYEPDGINYRSILLFAGGLVAAAVLIHLLLYWVLQSRSASPFVVQVQVAPANVTPAPAPGPGIEAQPRRALAQHQAQALERLDAYGWVDAEAGTVHIPIERAMELLVERGLPAREGETPTFGSGAGPAYQLDSSGGVQPPGE
jgi:hypothetical protein